MSRECALPRCHSKKVSTTRVNEHNIKDVQTFFGVSLSDSEGITGKHLCWFHRDRLNEWRKSGSRIDKVWHWATEGQRNWNAGTHPKSRLHAKKSKHSVKEYISSKENARQKKELRSCLSIVICSVLFVAAMCVYLISLTTSRISFSYSLGAFTSSICGEHEAQAEGG